MIFTLVINMCAYSIYACMSTFVCIVCVWWLYTADSHEWLLGGDVDILPSLLLPLAGPEEFTEEETERLPVDLQYLPDDKAREEDPDIRKMLLEALTKVYTFYYIDYPAHTSLFIWFLGVRL